MATETIHWSLRLKRNSKNDAHNRGTTKDRRHHPIHGSRVFPGGSGWRRELHLGDAFRKETTHKTSTSPAPAADQKLGFHPDLPRKPPTTNLRYGRTAFKVFDVDLARSRPVSAVGHTRADLGDLPSQHHRRAAMAPVAGQDHASRRAWSRAP